MNNKVIVRGNNFIEQPTYLIGTFEGYGNFGLPIVNINNTKYLSMGVVLPYSEQLCTILDKMTAEQQWNWCKELVEGLNKYKQQEH